MNTFLLHLRQCYELLAERFPRLQRRPARRRKPMSVQLELPLGRGS
jgi:hypothetical protein